MFENQIMEPNIHNNTNSKNLDYCSTSDIKKTSDFNLPSKFYDFHRIFIRNSCKRLENLLQTTGKYTILNS